MFEKETDRRNGAEFGYNKDSPIGIVAKCSMTYTRDYLINGR